MNKFFILFLGLISTFALFGCGTQVRTLSASTQVKGKVVRGDGTPVGKVLLTLQPLGDGHPVMLDVDAEGNFQGEGIPGEYAYFVGSLKDEAKSKSTLSALPKEFLEASLDRKVVIGSTDEMKIEIP